MEHLSDLKSCTEIEGYNLLHCDDLERLYIWGHAFRCHRELLENLAFVISLQVLSTFRNI